MYFSVGSMCLGVGVALPHYSRAIGDELVRYHTMDDKEYAARYVSNLNFIIDLFLERRARREMTPQERSEMTSIARGLTAAASAKIHRTSARSACALRKEIYANLGVATAQEVQAALLETALIRLDNLRRARKSDAISLASARGLRDRHLS